MIKRSLEDVAKMIGITLEKNLDIEIQGVTIDSRKVEKGNLFVPFPGGNVDGHQYVEKAIASGAAAAFWKKDVPNPPLHLPILIVEDPLLALQELSKRYLEEVNPKVVGITGSNGKTTTKDITAALLSTTFRVHKTSGNFNNHLGLPLTILSMPSDVEVVVLEMGMSGKGEIELLSTLAQPDIAIITNIGEAHLLDLGSREGIAEAKLEIVKGLKPEGALVYHGDEPLLQERVSSPGFKTLSFGLEHDNKMYPLSIQTREEDTLFKTNMYSEDFILPVLGAHNVLNAMAAMLVANELSVTVEQMKVGLQSVKLTNMRMEMQKGINGEKVINDAYNASPSSMKAAMDLVAELKGFEKKILVLGDMLELGPNEVEFHKDLGKQVPSSVDFLFTFGRLGKSIAEGAENVLPKQNIMPFEDKEILITELQKHVGKDVLVLVKASRGMELEEVVHALIGKETAK
ncbi:UDP-N-acetylmuramoyl-tripeptide--D-alanyl-D-alanine ligase [Peribacillus alkalitolerans]|uniref:UDP-N-acetylmuramoyl-tripeptide--D-alanyl-D- alanine ligase n=1 Tax=Peribacillus alkalitolerans TaxID=1550385 RepID=UPI0013D57DEB|nr:UDP-N-acetylmuramoyl-tripeptide--D-alanyl-D-alanine ligase [Peribacillus alkalitolerans]